MTIRIKGSPLSTPKAGRRGDDNWSAGMTEWIKKKAGYLSPALFSNRMNLL
jgi:hypothetical protein